MTNEEAKVFLDNLKICIEEHPIIADWLVEIADRKTENSSENPNNCDDCIWSVCNYNKAFEDEPQLTPNYCGTCKHREVPCGDLPCDVCHGYSNYEPKDEPQTERSSE